MNENQDNTDSRYALLDLRTLSEVGFAAYGVGQIAYVKTVINDGQPASAIHDADGRQLAVVETRDLAFAVIRQNDIEGLSAH
jgi:hypothetical protein